MKQPSIGISACLVGQPVRFDGQHCRHNDLLEHLGHFVTWHPLCPEMEMGLGAPRETMRLVQDQPGSAARLVLNKSGGDLTALAEETSQRILPPDLDLDGYILKKDSPTCGLERVRIYQDGGIPDRTGRGIFAAHLARLYPLLPMIEEGRLTDPEQREHFLTRVYAWHRLRQVSASIGALQDFHRKHKLLMMSHSPKHYQETGRLAANVGNERPEDALARYRSLFSEGLAIPSSRGKRCNVLHHLMGYFKDDLNAAEKADLLESIEDYRQGVAPLLAPLTLIQHLMVRYDAPYLEDQVIFLPHPKALGLRRAI